MKWKHVLMIAAVALIILVFHKEKKKIDEAAGS